MKAKPIAFLSLLCALCLFMCACGSAPVESEEAAEDDEAVELSEEEHPNELASPIDAQGNPIDFTISDVVFDSNSLSFQVSPTDEDAVLYLYVNSITANGSEYAVGKSEDSVTFAVNGEEESSWSMRMQKGSTCSVSISFGDASFELDEVSLNCDETLAKKNGNTFTETNAYSDFNITIK